jgi:hypothetical protein
MSKLPQSQRPAEISKKLYELGRVWAYSEFRPRIPHSIKAYWDALLDEWAESDLPLVIRKGGGIRGSVVKHRSGRPIVIADNSPAQWSFTRAFGGQLYSLADIRTLLDKDSIPFTFATKTTEKSQMIYKCTLSSGDNLNKRGWKLCHIEDVGLKTKSAMETLSLESLVDHFKLLMAPSNHFLIPLDWGGLGEVPEVIKEIAAVEKDFVPQ